jgi:hypothetical protein
MIENLSVDTLIEERWNSIQVVIVKHEGANAKSSDIDVSGVIE